jgi:hypothetical protein
MKETLGKEKLLLLALPQAHNPIPLKALNLTLAALLGVR